MNIFYKDDYKILLEQCELHHLEVISYYLMTKHVHLIVIAKTVESLSKKTGETHRLYTRRINFEQKVKWHLFQSRFYSTPLDEQHLINAIKYVEQNPVKGGTLRYQCDYKYSSVLHRIKIKEDILLSDYDLINEIKDYKIFLQETSNNDELKEKTRTGRPYRDKDFYKRIQEITGVDYLPKKRGPKTDECKK